MRLILLGPPGCGKGTQAKLLCQRLGLEHIGTGDILRDYARKGTPAGLRAKPFLDSGLLAPDDVVNEVVAERFDRPDRPDRFVMDGYPRTRSQAEVFDKVLRRAKLKLDAAVLIKVDDEEIIRRLEGRWSCPKSGCKATYHTESNPPKVAGVCDLCGTELVQRADDKPETVRARLVVYHGNTQQLIPYYRDQGLLREADGTGAIEAVYGNIMKALNPQAGKSC